MASFVAFFFFFFFFRAGWGGGGGGGGGDGMFFLKKNFCLFCFCFLFFDGKSVMPMFCNAMLLLLYVHVCVTRTGWKTRPRPKTVILLIKQLACCWDVKQPTNKQTYSLPLSLPLSLPPSLSLLPLSTPSQPVRLSQGKRRSERGGGLMCTCGSRTKALLRCRFK